MVELRGEKVGWGQLWWRGGEGMGGLAGLLWEMENGVVLVVILSSACVRGAGVREFVLVELLWWDLCT